MPIYENISGLTDLNAEQKLKIAIVGEQKTGKSWLALSAPGPTFHMDFDDRVESIKEYVRTTNRTDITVKSYLDRDFKFPTAVQELEKDLEMFKYLKKQNKEIPSTFILDSMTFLRAACERELMRQEPKFASQIKIGAKGINIAKGWDVINGNRSYLEYIIGNFTDLGNIICIFHELDEKDVQRSTKDEKAYTGRKTIQPQYLATLLSVFNDVFRISLDYTGKRSVLVKPSNDFLASTSMALDVTEEPDISKMIAKHKKARGLP